MDSGQRFIKALKARGYESVPDFARKTGIPPASLYDVSNGRRPRRERLNELCALLKIDEGVWFHNSDEAFDAMLSGGDAAANAARTFTLHSALEADGVATGPHAWKYFTSEASGSPADSLDRGRGARSGTASIRSIDLAGVPFGLDVFEVRASEPIFVLHDGRVTDLLAPGEIMIVSHEVDPEEGDVVLAKYETEDEADEHGLRIRFARFHRAGRLAWLIPFDENETGVQQVSNGWEVVGVVVERRRVREPKRTLTPKR